MDINYFNKLWQSSNKTFSLQEKYWDNRADEFIDYSKSNKKIEKQNNIISLLKERFNIINFQNVLDIGCGPGSYTFMFSDICKFAVGIDVSDKMIEYANNQKTLKNVDNVLFKKMYWEEAGPNNIDLFGKFDLVFASMSPAVHDLITLEKMISAGSKYYFVNAFVSRTYKLYDIETNRELIVITTNPHGNKAYCLFNILWLKRLYPEVIYIDNKDSEVDISINIINRFKNRHHNDITNELSKLPKERLVKLTNISKVALIFWEKLI